MRKAMTYQTLTMRHGKKSDLGLICGVYVVPDTALSWAKKAMTEVFE